MKVWATEAIDSAINNTKEAIVLCNEAITKLKKNNNNDYAVKIISAMEKEKTSLQAFRNQLDNINAGVKQAIRNSMQNEEEAGDASEEEGTQ